MGAGFVRFVENALAQVILFLTRGCPLSRLTLPWLREVHDVEEVTALLACVFDSEVEPLLVALSVCVDLHVEVVVF